MKLTKKLETEIKALMNDYWDSYFRGDLKHWRHYLVDDYRNIGGTEEEIWNSKKEILDYTKRVIDQMIGKAEIRNKKTQVISYDPYIMVHEFMDLFIKVEGKWSFYGKFRLSSLIQKGKDGWKVLHQHGSYPDAHTEQGEAFAFDKLRKENTQLREAVKRRTVELEQKNRELEIETALEKVRAVATGMKKPEDMLSICKTISARLSQLGVKEIRNVQTAIFYESKGTYMNYEYYAKHNKTVITETSYTNNKIHKAFARQMLKGKGEIFVTHIKGKKVKQWLAYQKTTNVFIDKYLGTAPSLNYYWHSLGPVALGISTYAPLIKEELDLFQRFLKVFELAYRRYLDIEKAEAQAREAQIQLALERVRARTMAMRKSEELQETAFILFKEFQELGEKPYQITIGIFHEEERKIEFSITGIDGSGAKIDQTFRMDIDEPVLLSGLYKAWKKHRSAAVFEMSGAELRRFDHYRNKIAKGKIPRAKSKKGEHRFVGVGYFSKGFISFSKSSSIHAETLNILERFAGVFDLTYTRFLDLQKAEAQAREAQIEAALEKVRSRSLAMHKSDELKEVIRLVLEQFIQLKINVAHAGFYIDYKMHDDMHIWLADPNIEPYYVTLPYFDTPTWNNFLKAKTKGTNFHTDLLNFEEKNNFYQSLFKLFSVPEAAQEFYLQCKGLAVSTVLLDSVGLYIENFDGLPYSEEDNKILMRFGKVFQQTYTRFLDLQKAEAQAREAQIESALEKVRSRTMAMQHSDELAETAAVLFRQLIALGIEPNRLYIILIKEDNADMEAWVTDEDGSKVSMGFTGNFRRNNSLLKMYEGWKAKRNSLIIDMQGEELKQYFHYLHDDLHVPFKGGLEQKRRVQHIAYFSHGLIGMASPELQPAETLQLLERFAAVFNLTFTRFNDLKIAEAHALKAEQDLVAIKEAKQRAEEALTELQATQKQLVQSEKMASLGELTAGIAHEIQNPLNFVNNFSEVSKELLDEMREAIEKGDTEDAKEIMNDVIQNLEKINHHGKRADGIVKGMLQHSRAGSGQKEPTDLNALCDEYLRLAYHGLRAKDKSFNAKFETAFDDTIGRINVLPQDMGRVILNLINNAFYAVTERKFKEETGYEPTVTVRTAKHNDQVVITVKDNGTGIPQRVMDKIFQPFFTTKPTGQGTGLGLSLSYDIITKGHGGELSVETKEGEGTVFNILLPL